MNPPAEDGVESLVRIDTKHPGEGWCVFLEGVDEEEVCLGPYANPSVAREQAEKIQKYLAALIRKVSYPGQAGAGVRP